jgi:hypothetical protein
MSHNTKNEYHIMLWEKDFLIDYLVILHLQFSGNNYKEIYSKIKYTWWHNMLWWLRRWKISISGGSQVGNWWLPRRIIFKNGKFGICGGN